MSYYTGFQNLAARMIRDKGVSVTIRRTIPATFDPATGMMGSPAVTDHVVNAIFSAVDIERVDGTNVLFTDLVAKIPAEGLSILPAAATDVIIRGSDTYGIKEVSVIQPADLALLYEVRCGK